MAAWAGAEFVPIPIRQGELADHFADTIWHAETLVANAHSAAKFLLSRAVQQAGFKVVLTGEGSDEVLAGYPFFRQDLIDEQGERDPLGGKASRQHLQASNPVSHGILLSDDPAATLPGVQRLLGFAPGYFLACKSIGDKMSTWLRDDGQAELVARDGFRRVLMNVDVLGQLVGRARLNQSLYLSSKTHLPNYMLSVLGDRMEMAHSVEGRLPFLDHPLVELLTQVPPRLKIHELTEKYVLREAARELIPKSVYERQKHPFLSPPSALDPQGAFYRMTQDILRGRAVETLPFVDAGKVRATLDQISGWSTEDKTAWDPPIMLLLSAVILGERFGMQASL
jgi:asparagine synthase (glutamine-hydrolysing)